MLTFIIMILCTNDKADSIHDIAYLKQPIV